MAIPFPLMHPRQEAMNYTFEELLLGGTVGRKLNGGPLAATWLLPNLPTGKSLSRAA
jgi:hypothetical protein